MVGNLSVGTWRAVADCADVTSAGCAAHPAIVHAGGYWGYRLFNGVYHYASLYPAGAALVV